jgi:hypothetical protein
MLWNRERRRVFMGAKQKLNSAHLLGCALLAGLVGDVAGSWWAFLIAFAVLLVAAYHAGDLRR